MADALKILLLALVGGAVIANTVILHQDALDSQKEIKKLAAVLADGAPSPGQGQGRQQPPADKFDVDKHVSAQDPGWGPVDAKVVMVEFSDFQCPFCSRFAQNTAGKLREAYGDKIRFVFKNLPLKSIHPHATGAAAAAQCAHEQGKFWEYYDKLFENQRNLEAASLIRYAGEIGLDSKTFSSCVVNPKIAQKVENDIQTAVSLGITGTPGFLINGVKISGAQPFENFKKAIDEALNN